MKKTKREVLAPTSIFIVHHGGYPFSVMVCIGATDAEVKSALKSRCPQLSNDEVREHCDIDSGSVQGRFSMFSTGQSLLRLKNFTGTPLHYGQLAHEVFHAVDDLFLRIGIKHSNEGCEAYAYAIQGLMETIVSELAKPPSLRADSII